MLDKPIHRLRLRQALLLGKFLQRRTIQQRWGAGQCPKRSTTGCLVNAGGGGGDGLFREPLYTHS